MPNFQVSGPTPDDIPQSNITSPAQSNTATNFSNVTDGGSQPITTAFFDNQNPSPDVEFDNREQITVDQLPEKVCTECLENNLIEAGIIEKFQTCPRCNELFCIHGVSKLDPQLCVHCCNDFKIVDVIDTIQRPVTNAKGEVTGTHRFKVRHITLSGMHWLFAQRAITTMSDVELEHAIEYHLNIYHGMIYEREARRVVKSQRNKGKIVGNEQISLEGSIENPFIQTQEGVKFAAVYQKATKVRKVRTKSVKVSQSSLGFSENQASPKQTKSKSVPSQETINAFIQTLLKHGMTPEQIKAIGKK